MAIIILGLAIFALYKLKKNRRKNAHRRQAIKLIDQLCQAHHEDSCALAQQILGVLKRVSLCTYAHSKGKLSSLHGQSWASFMSYSCPTRTLNKTVGQQLSEASYRPNISVDTTEAKRFATTWIKRHRVLDAQAIEHWLEQNPRPHTAEQVTKDQLQQGEAQPHVPA